MRWGPGRYSRDDRALAPGPRFWHKGALIPLLRKPYMPPSDETVLSAARAAFDQGDLAGAGARVTAHLAAQPDDIKALALLANIQEKLGAMAESADTVTRLAALAPARVDAAGYRMLAKFRMFEGKPDIARAVLGQALAVYPQNLDLHIMHAGLAGDLKKVCTALEGVVALAANDPNAVVIALKALVGSRAHLARQRAGLPDDAVSWEDTCAWPDPEGLERFRQVISNLNKQAPRPDLVIDAACVAICQREWDRADDLLAAVRERVPGTLADYTAFGAAFHAGLDRFDYAAIAGLLPPVHHILSPAPQSGETMLFGSDPGYFRKFTAPFIAAVDAMKIPADIQVHIMGGDAAAWREMAAGLDQLSHVRVGFSAEDPGAAGANIGLYTHAIRFVRQYLEAARLQRRIWAFDVDGFVQHDPRPLLGRLAEYDVSIRTNPILFTPPARVAGNFVGIAPTPLGLEYGRRTAAYIMYWKERGTWSWGIDQVALHSAYAHMARIGQEPKTYFQGAADVSNADDNDAVFYFPTGIKKYFFGKARG